MHANARRRSFGARALGPGGHLGLQRLVVLFEKSRVGFEKPTKSSSRGLFWTLGQGPRRRLSNPERVPWSARTGGEEQSRSLFGPAARPSFHHSCFFRTLDEE